MNDWAKRLADEVKQQQGQAASDNAKVLETQRLKKEFGPILWRGIVAELKHGCAAINRELRSDVAVVVNTSENELKVRNENILERRLTCSFDVDKGLVDWDIRPLRSGGSARGHYEVAIDKDGKAQLYQQGPHGESLFGEPSSSSEIAERMLAFLFRD
jgi:hypothetical protein